MKRIKSTRIIIGEELFDGYVYIDGGRIVKLSCECEAADECIDLGDNYLCAGFIDMHTHGGNGNCFLSDDPEVIAKGCDFHLNHGTTSILPTLAAGAFDVMYRATDAIKQAKERGLSQANIIGAHLEGPYFSPRQCGAQRPEFITPPVKEDYVKLVEDMKGAVSRWSYAPELDEGAEFCRYLNENGILPSVAHTDATLADVDLGMANGLKLVTHLYSCTSTITRNKGFRILGVNEAAYLRDGMYVEIIADGKHLPPELIQLIIKIKGKDRVALVTDSLEIVGTDSLEGFTQSVGNYVIEDGVCKLPDRSAFAGSIATADRLIRTLNKECGYSIPFAVYMLTETPANILGLSSKGRIEEGRDADLVAFDDDVNISAVFVGGERRV